MIVKTPNEIENTTTQNRRAPRNFPSTICTLDIFVTSRRIVFVSTSLLIKSCETAKTNKKPNNKIIQLMAAVYTSLASIPSSVKRLIKSGLSCKNVLDKYDIYVTNKIMRMERMLLNESINSLFKI